MSVLKYIELKSGYSDNGPAWIARVGVSKSGRTLYFNGKPLKRGQGISANRYDLETGEEYWVSNVKKDGSDRHWAGSGRVSVEASAVADYLAITAVPSLIPLGSMLSQTWSVPSLLGSTVLRTSPCSSGGAAELAVGVDVALFISGGAPMIGVAFVEFVGLLKAGHATQPQC